jgi:hypothetical protein
LALGIQAMAPTAKFDAGRAWEHLRQLVAIGPRPSGSPAIEQTRKYIKEQLAASGLTAVEQAWDDQTPLDKVHMVNLVVTIPGTRKERIVIAGHYDTKLYRQFRFVGASDGGSSAAFLLELARVLRARKNPMTIELLFLDGEEARMPEWNGTDNTYGSRHYVDLAKRDGSLASLKALLLVDMIGDRDLDIRRDTNSTPWLTNVIWETARRQNLDAHRGRPFAVSRGRHPVGGHHRSRLRGVAYRQGLARRRQRAQPPGRRRRRPGRAPDHRGAPLQDAGPHRPSHRRTALLPGAEGQHRPAPEAAAAAAVQGQAHATASDHDADRSTLRAVS